MKILDDLKALGYSISLEGENIRLKYLGIGDHPAEAQPLIKTLKVHKAEAVEYLKAQRPLPTLDAQGGLERLPFTCDPRFHYWRPGGQGVAETEKEVVGWKH